MPREPAAATTSREHGGAVDGAAAPRERDGPSGQEDAADDPTGAEILRRLRSVEGHVRGIHRMVEEGAYCIDLVRQILAVQRALKRVSTMVLDRHLHTCVTTAIRGRDVAERERVIGEILQVFEATGKT